MSVEVQEAVSEEKRERERGLGARCKIKSTRLTNSIHSKAYYTHAATKMHTCTYSETSLLWTSETRTVPL